MNSTHSSWIYLKRKEAPPLLVELSRLFALKHLLFHEDHLTLVSYSVLTM
jgi:hypothetical protein